MKIVEQHPFVWGLVLAAIAVGVATLDYKIVTDAQPREVIYQRPPTEAACRDPIVNKELRIWVDKRTSEKEGVRTCRVVPISGDDSPRKAIRGVLKQKGLWL